jgi:predicted transglutaminase-like protease
VRIETVRLLVRVCKDMWIISIVQFVSMSQSIEVVSKQIVGWERSA